MLPKTSIHINPKFRKVHINPSFLGKSIAEKHVAAAPSHIYINPKFLQHHSYADTATTIVTSNDLANIEPFLQYNGDCTQRLQEPLADTSSPKRNKIITKNRWNQTAMELPAMSFTSSNFCPVKSSTETKALIKIGMRKLIRVGTPKSTNIVKIIPKIRKPILTKYKIVKEQTAYKIDRRSVKCKRSVDLIAAEAAVTARKQPSTSLRRTWINESLVATKVIRT